MKTLHSEYDAFATSAMTKQISKGLVKGRPCGGTGFLFRRELSKCIRARPDIIHERITVLEMNSSAHKILLINAYMPYFISGNNETQLAEYCETLSVIQSTMLSHPNHKYIVLMDMNCDLFDSTHAYFITYE